MAIEIFDSTGDYLEINSDGSINIGSSSDTSVLSGQIDTLQTYEQQAYWNDAYSRVVQSRGTDQYIALAPVGSSVNSDVWQVQKIDTDGARQWADSAAFTQAASGELSGLSFAY